MNDLVFLDALYYVFLNHFLVTSTVSVMVLFSLVIGFSTLFRRWGD